MPRSSLSPMAGPSRNPLVCHTECGKTYFGEILYVGELRRLQRHEGELLSKGALVPACSAHFLLYGLEQISNHLRASPSALVKGDQPLLLLLASKSI